MTSGIRQPVARSVLRWGWAGLVVPRRTRCAPWRRCLPCCGSPWWRCWRRGGSAHTSGTASTWAPCTTPPWTAATCSSQPPPVSWPPWTAAAAAWVRQLRVALPTLCVALARRVAHPTHATHTAAPVLSPRLSSRVACGPGGRARGGERGVWWGGCGDSLPGGPPPSLGDPGAWHCVSAVHSPDTEAGAPPAGLVVCQGGGGLVWDTVLEAPTTTWGATPHLLFLQPPRGTHAHDTSLVVATSAGVEVSATPPARCSGQICDSCPGSLPPCHSCTTCWTAASGGAQTLRL